MLNCFLNGGNLPWTVFKLFFLLFAIMHIANLLHRRLFKCILPPAVYESTQLTIHCCYHFAIIIDEVHDYLIIFLIWNSLITHQVGYLPFGFSHLEFFSLHSLPIINWDLTVFVSFVWVFFFCICFLLIIFATDIVPCSLSFNIAYDFLACNSVYQYFPFLFLCF